MKYAVLTLVLVAGSANAGFICEDKYLYTSSLTASIATYHTQAECRNAVAESRNGFICFGRHLLNSISSSPITKFENERACLEALVVSK